jgi:hypothetical protein
MSGASRPKATILTAAAFRPKGDREKGGVDATTVGVGVSSVPPKRLGLPGSQVLCALLQREPGRYVLFIVQH